MLDNQYEEETSEEELLTEDANTLSNNLDEISS